MYDGRNRLIARKTGENIDYKLIYAGQLAPVAKLDESEERGQSFILRIHRLISPCFSAGWLAELY